MRKCPKCNYERTKEDDQMVSSDRCPKCGVLYSKLEVHALHQKIKKLEAIITEKDKAYAQAEQRRQYEADLEASQTAKENAQQSLINSVWDRLDRGEKCFIYDKIYLPVNSIINKEEFTETFDTSTLETLGLQGWDIVAVVPRTVGVALTNTSGLVTSAWGGGIGGNIIGVYIILKKEVIPSMRGKIDDLIVEKLS